jgi:RNA polymerase sigma-70 factor, ECF subfamily
LAAGDAEAEAHFSAYFERFLSLKLRSRRLSRQMSDDVRQETLYRVLRTLRHGSGVADPNRFGSFVNAVCNNVLLEFQKKARDSYSDDAGFEPPDKAIPIDEALITEQRKKAVAEILDSLSARDQEILRMVFFDELNRTEVCRRLGAESGHVRVLLHRARARFEAAFQKSYKHFACLPWLFCNALAGALTISQRYSFARGGA